MMIQKQDNFPFLKDNSPKNRMLCLHNAMQVEFSRSFPDYAIFIFKFKINECFLFMKRFKFTSWRHLKIGRR